MIQIDLLSLFPSYFDSPLSQTMLLQAQEKGLIKIKTHDLRAYSEDKHRRVDRRPFGGGPGMVMQAPPLNAALKDLESESACTVYLSPKGEQLTPELAKELSTNKRLILVSGHYEGVDERVMEKVDREVSIGDYVLTNGCLASLVLLDCLIRYVPGVLGDERSHAEDSFEEGLLDHPHYTHPAQLEGKEIPPVLRGGNHKAISAWRREKALYETFKKRPDLFLQFFEKEGSEKRGNCGKLCLFFFCADLKKATRFYKHILGFSRVDANDERCLFRKEEVEIVVIRSEPFVPSASFGQINVTIQEFENILARAQDQESESLLFCRDGSAGFTDPAGNLWLLKVR